MEGYQFICELGPTGSAKVCCPREFYAEKQVVSQRSGEVLRWKRSTAWLDEIAGYGRPGTLSAPCVVSSDSAQRGGSKEVVWCPWSFDHQLVRRSSFGAGRCTGVQNDEVLEFNFARWLASFCRDRVASKCHGGRLINGSVPFEKLLLHAGKNYFVETAWRLMSSLCTLRRKGFLKTRGV